MNYEPNSSKIVTCPSVYFFTFFGTFQGLINLQSERKHESNLGTPHVLTKLKWDGGEEDSTNAIKKTYINILLVLSVTFYTYKYYRNYNVEKDFSKHKLIAIV